MASYANEAEVLWLEPVSGTPQIQAVVLDAQKVPATSNNNELAVYREMDRVTVSAPSASRVTLPFVKDLDTWAQSTGLLPPVPTISVTRNGLHRRIASNASSFSTIRTESSSDRPGLPKRYRIPVRRAEDFRWARQPIATDSSMCSFRICRSQHPRS